MNGLPTRRTTSASVPPKTGPCVQNVSVNSRAGNGIGKATRLRRRLRQAAVLLQFLLQTAIFVAHTDASPRQNRPTSDMDAIKPVTGGGPGSGNSQPVQQDSSHKGAVAVFL